MYSNVAIMLSRSYLRSENTKKSEHYVIREYLLEESSSVWIQSFGLVDLVLVSF